MLNINWFLLKNYYYCKIAFLTILFSEESLIFILKSMIILQQYLNRRLNKDVSAGTLHFFIVLIEYTQFSKNCSGH